jgi:dephospho-CoA kinase
VVVTDEATQRARLMARDGMTTPEATARMATQMPVTDKAKLADYVIDNSGDRAATQARTREVVAALLAELRAREQR